MSRFKINIIERISDIMSKTKIKNCNINPWFIKILNLIYWFTYSHKIIKCHSKASEKSGSHVENPLFCLKAPNFKIIGLWNLSNLLLTSNPPTSLTILEEQETPKSKTTRALHARPEKAALVWALPLNRKTKSS